MADRLPETMRNLPRVVVITALVTIPALAAVQPPQFGTGTLSFIDDGAVELRYKGWDEALAPASFVQTLAAVSIAASTPPNPLNPWFVETAVHALGIPHKDYESCWPDQGAIVIVPTAPAGAVDAALGAAGAYFDPAHQAREFEAAYWNRLFTYRSTTAPAPDGWPGDPTMESLKETVVGSLPFPANLGTMDQYARRGGVPLLELRGEYAPVCFLFFCIWFPKCIVVFTPTAEGYGIQGTK
jgi:hypothetical protein